MTKAEYKERRKAYWRATRRERWKAHWHDFKSGAWVFLQVVLIVTAMFVLSGWCGH